MPQWACAEGIIMVVDLVTPIFLKNTKNQMLATAVHAQRSHILNLIVLDFWVNALLLYMYFEHCCGAFLTSQMTNLLAVVTYSFLQQNYKLSCQIEF